MIEQKTPHHIPFLKSKYIFIISVIVVALTSLLVWIGAVKTGGSTFILAIDAISIIALILFLFLFWGLYKGVKLKEDVGYITDKISTWEFNFFGVSDNSTGDWDFDFVDIDGDSVFGSIISFLVGIIAWIFISFFFGLILYLIGIVLWSALLFLFAILYWVFYRAMKLVFKRSKECKGNLLKSFLYASIYTMFYTSWIYGLIFILHYFI